MPRNPADVMVVVPVPPTERIFAESLVEDAFPNVDCPVTLSVPPIAVLPVSVKLPTTVEEACETKPPTSVERPRLLNTCVVSEPSDAVCAKRLVEDATVEKRFVEVALARVVLPVTESEPRVERPVTFRVEVAVIAPPKNDVPEVYWLPCTPSVCVGDVVPMPMLPKYPVPLAVRFVVEAPPFAEKRPEVIVEDALERNPFVNVARPVCVRVPATVNAWADSVPSDAVCANRLVDDARPEKKFVEVAFASVVFPWTFRAPPNRLLPVVVKLPATVDDACDTNPLPRTERPPTERPPAKLEFERFVTERFVSVDVPAVSAVIDVVPIVTAPIGLIANIVLPEDDAIWKIFPVCPATPWSASVGSVVEPDWLDINSDWLNSKRFAVEFQARIAFGTTLPRKKMSEESSVSAVLLPEFMVNVESCVPPICVLLATMLLAVNVLMYPLFQKNEGEPKS